MNGAHRTWIESADAYGLQVFAAKDWAGTWTHRPADWLMRRLSAALPQAETLSCRCWQHLCHATLHRPHCPSGCLLLATFFRGRCRLASPSSRIRQAQGPRAREPCLSPLGRLAVRGAAQKEPPTGEKDRTADETPPAAVCRGQGSQYFDVLYKHSGTPLKAWKFSSSPDGLLMV